jgi:putative restriction endonuclease
VEPEDLDALVRLAAFEFLEAQTQIHGDVLSRVVLREGFLFRGHRIRFVGPQGIFKPALLPEIPLSITTAPAKPGRDRPYDDSFGPEGLRYRYRGSDPMHHENIGLRKAMQRGTPLVYFHGLVPGQYFAAWPVYVVGDDPDSLSFTMALDDHEYILDSFASVAESGTEARRAYVTAVTRKRVHQQAFRERVLAAYRQCCALCRLRHEVLLDAAHILPDSEPEGEPVVSNGLALCKLHHAAFDENILAVRPDYIVEIRSDVLDEIDGPMLIHGLQGFHGKRILVPRTPASRPNPEFLEERFRRFLRAS